MVTRGVNDSVNPSQPSDATDDRTQNLPLSISSEQEMRTECTLEGPWPTAANGANILDMSPDVFSLENPQYVILYLGHFDSTPFSFKALI
ncbi:hypothetical protein N7490_008293 [Penicillium lividum]|nr:hypothetical protein N7490_008293 [Penicillium lividum]